MEKLKALFLAANPRDTDQLGLDEEIREISQKIRLSDGRDVLDIISAWATRPDDLLQYLNQHKPNIVHFSGHGTATGEIVLQDKNSQAKPVTTSALKALFRTLKDNIQLVILNACYSRTQAKAIAEVINYVVGMNSAIGDEAAIIFSASFYRALGFERTIQEAFDQAKTALLLEGILEDDIPELLVNKDADPNEKLGRASLISTDSDRSSLRLVDISIDEPSNSFPVLDVKLRNIGNEVVFLKKAKFKILKVGKLRNPSIGNYQLIPVSWNYNVMFTEEPAKEVLHNISQALNPNSVDRFTFTIGQRGGDPVLPTLYYFQLALTYNEDDQSVTSRPIILPVPSDISWGGMFAYGFDKETAKRNLEILKEFSRLDGLMSNSFKEIINNNLSQEESEA
jgi:hypothetical protein